ncbi:MAG TPA: carboxypeptidase regulatory-like domain-containing protein [Vicinamibacterales bacterium]|nr:carboxypeptidase regulatory-like domain-containing protein [Vicinamibacterales bacterium]
MRMAFRRGTLLTAFLLAAGIGPVFAQATTGTIQGTIRDNQGGVVPGTTVMVRHVATNTSRSLVSDSSGTYRFLNMPVGEYELVAELPGFTKYVRSGINLSLNQDAIVDVQLAPAGLTESVEVRADASILNTRNAEVGVRFDTTRVSELPVMNSRDVFALALSAPGVSQLGSGQSAFASGTNFSSNGMRVRSNNFMIDGQDSNDPSVTGRQQPINNTDIVQEMRLITNQFAAEYGRAAGSVVSVATKSGTNVLHGSAFVFHNDESLNSRSNLDKRAGRDSAPFREEQQYGGTIGGPIFRNRTFFFGSYQRWTDRQLGSGFTLSGAPTEAGRAILQQFASRPQVAALLQFVQAGAPNGKTAQFTANGQTFTVPLGDLTGSSSIVYNNNQFNGRVDHEFTPNHRLTSRYIGATTPDNSGSGQVTPVGLTTQNTSNQHSLNTWLTSLIGQNLSNEFRVAWSHLGTNTGAFDASSETIPSLEITELGMTGFNAAANRTAIGLAVNLPQFRHNDTYQFQNNLTWVRGNHVMKTGADVRYQYVKSFFFPTIRGLLRYATLQSFMNDVAEAANINKPLPGGEEVNYYRWWDQYYYAQDEWRLHPTLTLNLGVRYELSGNNIQSLIDLNERILEANGGDPTFALNPVPKTDKNNFQPRVSFNWAPRTDEAGLLGKLTGGDKLVLRGGYARTHDYAFLNIALNIVSSFPYVAAINRSNLSPAFPLLQATPPGVPAGTNPNLLTRTVVAEDFRSPYADQFSVEMQRQLGGNLALRLGYVGTFGKDLFQTRDGNPRQPFCGNPCTTGPRLNTSAGVIRMRANSAESWYNSLQTGLEKRMSGGISAALHYTWSQYLDTASEIFNPSSGEVAVPQDSFDIGADKGRSSYDRPHRLTGNFVWELPVMRDQQGVVGKILGGWQFASFFTFQSGAPFTPLNGSDPTGALAGIDGLVGNAIRPMLNTNLDLANMTIQELIEAGGASLFRTLCGMPSPTCAGERVGNAPRNLLRADGIGNVDLALTKNTRFLNGHNIQFRVEMYNATNTRNFGIPVGTVTSANFLNQWATDGGNRRVWVALRYTF